MRRRKVAHLHCVSVNMENPMSVCALSRQQSLLIPFGTLITTYVHMSLQ